MRSATVTLSVILVTIGYNAKSPGVGDESSTTDAGEEGSGEEGTDAGSDCEEVGAEPTGCAGVQFPGQGEPRTAGVVLSYEHPLFVSGPTLFVEFHDSNVVACGDTCECANEAFILVADNAFTGEGIYDLSGETRVTAYVFNDKTYDSQADECAYSYAQATAGVITILSVGDSCVAGTIEDMPEPFADIEGAFMAGACEK